ncbi:MAG: hypothetical protein ACOZQL_09420 [Myxococcota bacterium]
MSTELFDGLPPALATRATRLFEEDTASSLLDLLELLEGTPGPHLERFATELERRATQDDDHLAVAARAALRLGNRLRETAPEAALGWLEKCLALSAPSDFQELASLWSTAAFRLHRRRNEQDPSRLLEVSRELLVRAKRYGAKDGALLLNTLDFASDTVARLNATGRFVEAQDLAAELLTLEFNRRDDRQLGPAAFALAESGFAARKEGKLELARQRYEEARALHAGAPGRREHEDDLAWLIAEQLYTASLAKDLTAMLRLAEDFDREIPERRGEEKRVSAERHYARALRADALVHLGRLEEVDAALATIKTTEPNVGSLTGMVRARLAWARGDFDGARKHARAVMKKYANHETRCHDDLDAAQELLARP